MSGEMRLGDFFRAKRLFADEATKPSHKYLTMLWCLAVRVVSGYQPSLFSCQRSLPRLPVPPLHDTIERLLDSLKAVCTPEEMKVLEMQAQVINLLYCLPTNSWMLLLYFCVYNPPLSVASHSNYNLWIKGWVGKHL